MDYALSIIKDFPGSKVQGDNLVEEMKELGKLRTATLMEKCSNRNMHEQQQTIVVVCPKPRRLNFRSYADNSDTKVASDLSDILASKATPPYFSGSPPVRSTNPLSRDALFLKYKSP